MNEEVTYYNADELRNSLDSKDEEARTAFITEAGDDLIGGFYHNVKGDEWIVRRAEAPGVYIVTGSEFERRYDDGLMYDEHITPRLMAAYEEGMRAKLAEQGAEGSDDTLKFVLSGLRTSVCQAWCHPGRAHKVRQMAIDNDEWDAVREVIARAKAAS